MNTKDFLFSHAQDVLKRWSRSGINEFIVECLKNKDQEIRKILVVGGYGRVMSFMNREFPTDKILSLDINSEFKPDIVADLASAKLLSEIEDRFDFIVLVEVLEHIPDFNAALKNVYQLLNPGGVVIGSTPWSTPLHDKPIDFFRYTYFQLQNMLTSHEFTEVRIECRGNLLDSIIYLGLRGLKTWGAKGKTLYLLFAPLSLLMRKPRRYQEIQDQCIGYSFMGRK